MRCFRIALFETKIALALVLLPLIGATQAQDAPSPSAPSLTTQPPSVTNLCGESATLAMTASGSLPLTFLWHKDGVELADGNRVSGANTNLLLLTDLQATDEGDYSVVVSNAFGIVTSQVARLTVPSWSCAPNAWRITDNSAGLTGLLGYVKNLTAKQTAGAFTNGWRFTIHSRLVDDFGGSRTMAMAFGNGTTQFVVWWDWDASGNLNVRLDGGPRLPFVTQGAAAARAYHTYELQYNPITHQATYRFDGHLVTAWLGQSLSNPAGQVFWGAKAGSGLGQMDFHQVTFEILGTGPVATFDAGVQTDGLEAPSPVAQGWTRSPANSALPEGLVSANDDFANRVPLTGAIATAQGANFNASREPGELFHAGNSGGRSLWWTWTAPFTGGARITTAGSTCDTVLAAYTGNSFLNFTTIASVADTNAANYVTFQALAGTNYKIVVDGYNGATGTIGLGLVLNPTPANDDFYTPRLLVGNAVTNLSTSIGATKQAGEPAHADQAGGQSIWYAWTAPRNGCVTLATTGSDFDTLLAVYAGNSLASLNAVASNDDEPGQLTSALQFNAIAGTTYRIAVDGYEGVGGKVVLSLMLSGVPANDSFVTSLELGSNASAVGSNASATREAGEPAHFVGALGKSVWWHWKAPFSGGVTLSLKGSQGGLGAVVYVGSTLGSLTPVLVSRPTGFLVNDFSGGEVIFKATAGTTYRIAVDGVTGGDIRLALSLWPSPANDDFPIPTSPSLSGDLVLTATNRGATTEPNELPLAAHASGHSVWWKWSPAISSGVNVRTDGTDFPHILGVFTGSTLSNLTQVGVSQSGQINFAALRGLAYFFEVDGLGDAAGSIRLTVQRFATPANDSFNLRGVLSGSNIVVRTSNIGATSEVGEPLHAGQSGGRSLWWQWSTPLPGRVFLSTYGSSFDTLLAVYDGPDFAPSLSSLIPVASNDDTPACTTCVDRNPSFVDFDFAPRQFPQLQRLFFAVDGKGRATGDLTLAITFVARPAHDAFGSRLALSNSLVTTAGSIIAASREAGEPLLAGSNVARTVWYSWTAPTNYNATHGLVTLRVSGASFVPQVGVFQGNILSNLVPVTMENRVRAVTRELTFEAAAGATYQIAVGGDPDVARVGQSFVDRAFLGSPGTFTEAGSFSFNLEFATLALRVTNLEKTFDESEFPKKLTFSGVAEVNNYGSAESRPVRIRIVAVPSSPNLDVLTLGIYTPPLPGQVSPGENLLLPLSGASPVGTGAGLLFGTRWSLYALLDENVDGEWLAIGASLIDVILPTGAIPTGGGVILTDPPLGGADTCRWDIVSVEIAGPNFVVEGTTNAFSFRVRRQNTCSGTQVTSTLTNAPWECSLSSASLSSNGVLILPRGVVGTNGQISLRFNYEYRGVTSGASVMVPVYNREPILTNPSRLSDGKFRWTLNGPPAMSYLIQSSTDLMNWQNIGSSSTDSEGRGFYTNATTGPVRFYRILER